MDEESHPSEPRTARPTPRLVVGALTLVAAMAAVGLTLLGARLPGTPLASPAASARASSSQEPTASSGGGSSGGPTTRPSVSPSSPTPEPTQPPVAAPLTGLPVSPDAATRHVIAVMIDDQKDARPQSGFNAASQVWQAPAEGGIPRYMLLFQENVPGLVGPVRSSRQYYIEWASEWRAMYVHVGGSPQALQTLHDKGNGQLVWNADEFRWGGGKYLWRANDRPAPHNVYSDGEHLRALADRLGASDGPLTAHWTFGPPTPVRHRPLGGTVVVSYPYETITYRYDPTSNRYLRYIDGSAKPQVDAADGAVVAPTNVVVLRVRFGPLNDGNPAKKRLEASDVGSGEAWVATNGRTTKAIWKKSSVDGPTLLFNLDGTPLTLTSGQTFVQVLALSYGFDFHDEAPAPPGAYRPTDD